MDGRRFVKIMFLLSVLLVEMILGAPKCSGKWAIHSCGGGNGKRSEIDLAGDLEDLRQDERALPEFESPELEEFGGRTRLDDGYGSREDEEDLSSYRGRQANAREDSDYEDRRERLLDVLIRRLMKKQMAADYNG